MFPAPVGINRKFTGKNGRAGCVPRASGDKPWIAEDDGVLNPCSPRQRG
ncbi:hypothetical protein ECDEC5A_3311 [Escherichia coli DEC5A]|nr:hypothetical protein ECDEC5A_3311 [Escherichia coli DEC5A]